MLLLPASCLLPLILLQLARASRLCSRIITARDTSHVCRVPCARAAASESEGRAIKLQTISLRGCSVGESGLQALLAPALSLRRIEADACLWMGLEARGWMRREQHVEQGIAAAGGAHVQHDAADSMLVAALEQWELERHDHVTGACTLCRRSPPLGAQTP